VLRRISLPATLLLLSYPLVVQATTPLETLAPESVRARDPNQQATPQIVRNFVLPGSSAGTAIRFLAQSEVTYAIPQGEASFFGLLVFGEYGRLPVPQGQPAAFNRIRVRFLVNGKQTLEALMDHTTPAIEFSVPTAGGTKLAIVSDAQFSGAPFYLLQAAFSEAKRPAMSSYRLRPGEGYVEFLPLPRHLLFHVFRPSEPVPISAYFSGDATHANVAIRIQPEQGSAAVSSQALDVPLRLAAPGVASGTTNWSAPSWRGPAQVEIEERVAGRTVFRRSLRVAIAPDVDLSRIIKNNFGVHISTSGFLWLADEYASLWGAKWGRVYVRWSIVERNQGEYDFSRIDAVVDAYRRQGMRVLCVLGETSPVWAGAPSPEFYTSWKRFVAETVRHLHGKVGHWDVFNEIDVKYYSGMNQADQQSDLKLLDSAMDAVKAVDPTSKLVCCSTGTYAWLLYDKRLIDAGLLGKLDYVSLHPYQGTPPEEKDGVFDYSGRIDALANLIALYGRNNPIWSTEANWIMGPRGGPSINAPGIDEHTQAEFVVRVNLLSLARNVPYFLHAPFYHGQRPQLHLDTLSAYANMASLLSEARVAMKLASGPNVYALAWDTPQGTVGALWSVVAGARVRISRTAGIRFIDLYGNRLAVDPDSVPLSSEPVYFEGERGTRPSLAILDPGSGPAWKPLPTLETWGRNSASTYATTGTGVHVKSAVTQYAGQLVSQPLHVAKETCYVASLDVRLRAGSLMLAVVDSKTHENLGKADIAYVPDDQVRRVELRFFSGSSIAAQLILQDENAYVPTFSEFEVSRPQIAQCR